MPAVGMLCKSGIDDFPGFGFVPTGGKTAVFFDGGGNFFGFLLRVNAQQSIVGGSEHTAQNGKKGNVGGGST